MPYSVHRLRPGRALSRLMGFLVGVAIFLPLLAALIIWAGGRFAPSILDSALSSRSGCSLSVESNDTNLLLGRVRFGGLRVEGASRWQERALLSARELTVDFDPVSFTGDGVRVIRELRIDVDELVVVGKEDALNDNNLRDLIRSFSSQEPAGGTDVREPARFRIERLSLNVRRVRVIAGDGTDRRRTVVDREAGISLEASDVDEASLGDKVWKPLASRLTGLAVRVGVDAAVDRAREQVLRAAESLLSR